MAAGTGDEKPAVAAGLGAPPSGGGSKLVLILTLVNVLASLGMVTILFISFQRDRKKPTIEDISAHATSLEPENEKGKGKEGAGKEGEKKKPSEFGKMVTLEQFTVNLSTPGSANPKYVRVNISLEVPTDDAEAEVTTRIPQIRNTIIDLFNSKRPADLATADGREYLKDEIKTALNTFLVTGKIKGVFFTSFAIAG